MSKNARSRLWTRCFSRKPAPELPTAGLRFEQLEDRLAPATFNWTGASGGAGGNSNWSNPNNWLNELGQPQTPTGAVIDLVFPTGAERPANFNDLTNGTLINSITISGLGAGGTPYNLSENPGPGRERHRPEYQFHPQRRGVERDLWDLDHPRNGPQPVVHRQQRDAHRHGCGRLRRV